MPTNTLTPLLFFFCCVANFLIKIQTLFVQHGLTAGDVGANLYIFEAMARGEIPYHDFFWPYGPLMLYYNVIFFKSFGHNIHSVMWAKLIFESIFSGVFFLAAARIMPALAAVLAALAFSVFAHDFEHNFSHYGGVCMEIGLLWAVFSYCQSADKKYILWGWLFVLVLGFIKLNFGGFLLCGMCACLVLCDLFKHGKFSVQRLYQYAGIFGATVLIWVLVHYMFVRHLSLHEIKQCFPFFKGYVWWSGSISGGFVNIYRTTLHNIQQNRLDALIAGVSLAASLRLLFHMIWNHRCVIQSGRNSPLIIAILLIFTVLSYHEFLRGGLDYQAFWARPFTLMINAYVISEACVISGWFIQTAVILIISSMIVIQGHKNWTFFQQFKNEAHFFRHKGMNVYVTTDPRDIQEMLDTTDYIEKHIPQNTLFFSFPNNAIYYYLSEHKSPYRLFPFFKGITIPPEQEMETITNLEKKGVEYIVMGNVCYFGNVYGVLGQDFALLFNKYLHKNFEEVARFRNSSVNFWEGTRVFKKKIAECRDIRSPKDLD